MFPESQTSGYRPKKRKEKGECVYIRWVDDLRRNDHYTIHIDRQVGEPSLFWLRNHSQNHIV